MHKLTQVIFVSSCFVVFIYLLRLLYPYKPFLDDYIQYGVYSLYPNPIKDIFVNAGTFTTRPLANLFDIALFSHFGDILYIPYIFLSLMYLGFVLVLRRVLLKTDIELGMLYMIVSLLCPLNIEGTVWVSAATRIVPGLLIGSASSLILFGKKSFWRYLLFWIGNLSSLLFYEQSAVFVFLLIFLISYRQKCFLPALIAGINCLCVAAFYLAFREYGVFSYRMSLLSAPDLSCFLVRLTQCLRAAFFTLMQSGSIYVLPFAIVMGLYAAVHTHSVRISNQKLIFGSLVAVLSLLPIALVGDYNIPFRCLVVPLVGVSILIDCISMPRVSKVVAIILVTVFVSSSFVQFHRLDLSTEADKALLSDIASVAKQNKDKSISLYGAKSYYDHTAPNHAESIAAITSSDWAVTGAVRNILSAPHFPMIKLNSSADIKIYLTPNAKRVDRVR